MAFAKCIDHAAITYPQHDRHHSASRHRQSKSRLIHVTLPALDACWQAREMPDSLLNITNVQVPVKAIEDLRKYVDAHDGSPTADRLNYLCQVVSKEDKLALAELYALDWEAFEIAIELLRDWRIDRYYLRDGSCDEQPLSTVESTESRQPVTAE